jgi:hypothetical protein
LVCKKHQPLSVHRSILIQLIGVFTIGLFLTRLHQGMASIQVVD